MSNPLITPNSNHVPSIAEAVLALQGGSGQVAAGLVHLTIDVPLATLQAKTSGAAFDIGSALPTNAKVFGTAIKLLEELAGGSTTQAHVTVQAHGASAGGLQASTNVFTGAGLNTTNNVGAAPVQDQSGVTLAATVTLVGDTMANLTAGHFEVHVFYAVLP